MRHVARRWHAAWVLGLVLALVPLAHTEAQNGGATVNVDSPTDGQTFTAGQQITYTGWAAHPGGPGTGVDRVVIYDGPVIDGAKIIVEATYGVARDDVARTNPGWLNSGFRATEVAKEGTFSRWVYAHSPSNDGWTNKMVSFRVTGPPMTPMPTPRPAMTGRMPYGGPMGGGQYSGDMSGMGRYGMDADLPITDTFGPPTPWWLYGQSGQIPIPPIAYGPQALGGPFGAGVGAAIPPVPGAPFPPSSLAAPALTVMIGAGGLYAPITAQVPVGSTVRWTNGDTAAHTATSEIRLWDSGVLTPGQSYSYTFLTAGVYRYLSVLDGPQQQRGVIIVQ